MAGLSLYIDLVLEEKGQHYRYVRKERLGELQEQFDNACRAHTQFVNQIYQKVVIERQLPLRHINSSAAQPRFPPEWSSAASVVEAERPA